jgi:hypothetical protein
MANPQRTGTTALLRVRRCDESAVRREFFWNFSGLFANANELTQGVNAFRGKLNCLTHKTQYKSKLMLPSTQPRWKRLETLPQASIAALVIALHDFLLLALDPFSFSFSHSRVSPWHNGITFCDERCARGELSLLD